MRKICHSAEQEENKSGGRTIHSGRSAEHTNSKQKQTSSKPKRSLDISESLAAEEDEEQTLGRVEE